MDCQIKELKLYPGLRSGFDGFRISIDGLVRTGGHSRQDFANFERKLSDAFRSISID